MIYKTSTLYNLPSRLQQHQQVPEPAAGCGSDTAECSVQILLQFPYNCDTGGKEEWPLGHGHHGYVLLIRS